MGKSGYNARVPAPKPCGRKCYRWSGNEGNKMIAGGRKIGDKEIMFLETFIIPTGEIVEFTFSPTHPEVGPLNIVNQVTLKVKVKVADTEGTVTAAWDMDNNEQQFLMITLPDVKGNLGQSTLGKPMKVGEFNGRNLGFNMALSAAGSSSVVTLQLMSGGAYE
jgi:hypothetical protein